MDMYDPYFDNRLDPGVFPPLARLLGVLLAFAIVGSVLLEPLVAL
jgi:hypothetical protein